MRRIRFGRTLPRTFAKHPDAKGLLHETAVGVSKRGRLKAKVLLFKDRSSLHRFWRVGIKQGSIRGSAGAVNQLASLRFDFSGDGCCEYLECDRNYFCVIGLVRGYCNVEIVAHESVHAGYAYEKRMKRNPFAAIHDLDEERVAYPTGRIASSLVTWLYEVGEYAKR